MNKRVKELCNVIGNDLSLLYKGDTTSALWPFIPNEAEYYTGEFFIKHLHSLIEELKTKNYSTKEVAKLFKSPSKIAQYFTLFHSATVLTLEERKELANELIKYLQFYRKDPYCRNGNNRLKQHSYDLSKLNTEGRNKTLSNNLSALLLLYLEIIYPTMMRLGHEFHGLYKKRNKSVFIKEFFNLSPTSLDLGKEFPIKRVKIVEEIEGGVKLDFFNHLIQNPVKKASYVEIDNELVQDSELEGVYENLQERVNKIVSETANFSRKEWFKVYARGLFQSLNPLKQELNHSTKTPLEVFSKIEKEDFNIPREKVLNFAKKNTREDLEEKIKKSYLSIFKKDEE